MGATKEEMVVRLEEPHEAVRESFLVALREFQAEGRYREIDVDTVAADFGSFVRRQRERANPALVPPHLVAETVLWLIDGNEFVGRASIRHELNEALRQVGGHVGYEIRPSRRREGFGTRILALTLERARAHGLREVLVTCDKDNLASRKIIEANGGRLENEFRVQGSATPKLRYWIILGNTST